MKKLIVLMTTVIFSLNAVAQDYQDNNKVQKENVQYCAKVKDGKTIVMQDKTEIIADVNLANGITIKRDGTVIRPDNSQRVLKNGECIDNKGVMVNPDEMKKEDKTEVK